MVLQLLGSYPAPNVIEAAASTKIDILSMSEDELKKTKRDKLIIPKGTYVGVDKGCCNYYFTGRQYILLQTTDEEVTLLKVHKRLAGTLKTDLDKHIHNYVSRSEQLVHFPNTSRSNTGRNRYNKLLSQKGLLTHTHDIDDSIRGQTVNPGNNVSRSITQNWAVTHTMWFQGGFKLRAINAHTSVKTPIQRLN